MIQWLTELDARGCFGVGFGGGEPTVYPGFSDLCRAITESTSLAVTFTTHGHHITDKFAAELQGGVHFIRVSMDGIGATYERLRGRRFSAFLQSVNTIRSISSFGINFVVNAQTLPELESAVELATDVGASEFLLLPEQPINGSMGIDQQSTVSLRKWVQTYRGPLPLRISEAGKAELPICDPMPSETGLRAYAHIDSSGTLKRSSFEKGGVHIGSQDIMDAFASLKLLSGIKK